MFCIVLLIQKYSASSVFETEKGIIIFLTKYIDFKLQSILDYQNAL